MTKKKYWMLFSVLAMVATALLIFVIIQNGNKVQKPTEPISEELRFNQKKYHLGLSADKTYYIIYGLKEKWHTDIRFPETIDDIPVKKIVDQDTHNFISFNNVNTIFIPKTVEYIGTNTDDDGILHGGTWGDSVFLSVSALNKIEVAEDNPVYASQDGVLYNKDKSVLIRCPLSWSPDISAMEFVPPHSVTSIYSHAFFGINRLVKISLSGGITKIGKEAFYNCSNLKTVIFGTSLTAIVDGAFQSCKSLRDIDLPEGLETLGNNAFTGCISINMVFLPNSITKYGNHIFTGCIALSNVYTPENNIQNITHRRVALGIRDSAKIEARK